MILIVLEDQYWEKISSDLLEYNSNFKLPIKWNIKDPRKYFNIIDNIIWDYVIILDNYFPTSWYEEAYWAWLLELLLKTWKNYKIICISDRWKRLLEDYASWKEAEKRWWLIWWAPSKDTKDIINILEKQKIFK